MGILMSQILVQVRDVYLQTIMQLSILSSITVFIHIIYVYIYILKYFTEVSIISTSN